MNTLFSKNFVHLRNWMNLIWISHQIQMHLSMNGSFAASRNILKKPDHCSPATKLSTHYYIYNHIMSELWWNEIQRMPSDLSLVVTKWGLLDRSWQCKPSDNCSAAQFTKRPSFSVPTKGQGDMDTAGSPGEASGSAHRSCWRILMPQWNWSWSLPQVCLSKT